MLWCLLGQPAVADAPAALAVALRHVAALDWVGARAAVQGAGPLAGDLVEWHLLRAGQGDAAAYVSFAGRRADWPGINLLLQKGEAAVVLAGPEAIIDYFAVRAPATGQGALALARAYRATDQAALAEAEAVRAWLDLSLTVQDQAGFLAEFGPALLPEHVKRLDRMIWAGNLDDAGRMLDLVPPGWKTSAIARMALLRGLDGVDGLVAAVPPDFAKGAGLAFARFTWRMDKGKGAGAADLLAERSTSAARLGQPGAWAGARAILARQEMRQGDPARAYRLAASHFLTPKGQSAADYADLEWLAGYIALQKLGDAQVALTHFRNLRLAVTSEISLGRAAYWEGRAQEALGRTDAAMAAYAYGAQHQTGFYGLLSAEKAGLPMNAALAGTDRYPDWRQAGFVQSSVAQAGLLLEQAGAHDLARRFFVHLSDRLSPTELGQLADMALDMDQPNTALMVAKRAVEKGVILYRAYYPLTDIATLALPVPAELALAIARRESEFDPAVVSRAGARGLMQLMPGTAKLMAPKLGIAYAVDRLTADPGYNATLGSAYLAQLRAEFGPSPLLVAAGYNAGPGRPRRWIEDFGDPRKPGIDPVDWIEAVPFTETRTYIMRVTESMLIYRARLAGGAVPIRLTEEMKGR